MILELSEFSFPRLITNAEQSVFLILISYNFLKLSFELRQVTSPSYAINLLSNKDISRFLNPFSFLLPRWKTLPLFTAPMIPTVTTPDAITGNLRAASTQPQSLLQTSPPQALQPPETLTNDELLTMRDNVLRLLRERGFPIPILPPPPPPPLPPWTNQAQCQFDAFDNAKYEQIACLGLKPPYDGSPSN